MDTSFQNKIKWMDRSPAAYQVFRSRRYLQLSHLTVLFQKRRPFLHKASLVPDQCDWHGENGVSELDALLECQRGLQVANIHREEEKYDIADFLGEPPNANHENSSMLCGLLEFFILAQPQMTHIDCHKPFVQEVICVASGAGSSASNMSKIKTSEAGLLQIYQNTCFLRQNQCELVHSHLYNTANVTLKVCDNSEHYSFLFYAVEVIFPPIFLTEMYCVISYEKYLGNIIFQNISILSNTLIEGLTISQGGTSVWIQGGNLFKCTNNTYISQSDVCDGLHHCSNHDDDDANSHHTGCVCNRTIFQKRNKTTQKTLCPELCQTAKDGSCKMYKFMSNHSLSISTKENNQSYELQCGTGSPTKFLVRDICKFELDETGQLMPCNLGEHLQNCTEFECNMMCKCLPTFYCIPWKYVCNGKIDCPGGTDEESCDSDLRTCKHMLSCRHSQICVHVGDTCNGKRDCPHQDDETLCTLSQQQCPANCRCLSFAIACEAKQIFPTKSVFPYHIISLRKTGHKGEHLGRVFQRAVLFKITNSLNIPICQILQHLKTLLVFDASANKLTNISKNCFKLKEISVHSPNRTCLKTVNLSTNIIAQIDKGGFSHLTQLFLLDLSHNQLKTLTFADSMSTSVMSVLNNSLLYLSDNFDILLNIKVNFLLAENYAVCCVVPANTNCSAAVPWYETCSDMLIGVAAKVVTFMVLFLNLFLGFLSLTLEKMAHEGKLEKTAAYGSTVAFIQMQSITYTTYLTILWSVDQSYRGSFVLSHNKWAQSLECSVAFFLALDVTLLFPVLSCFLATMRLRIVMRPVDTRFKETHFVFLCFYVIAFVVLSTSVVSTIVVKQLNGKIPSRFCFPVFQLDGKDITMSLLVWVVSIGQAVSCFLMMSLYIKLVVELKKSQKTIQQSISKKTTNTSLCIQLITLNVSDFFSGISSGIIYLFCFFQDSYPIEIQLWTVILISPVNLCVTSFVLTFVAVRKLWNAKKSQQNPPAKPS